MDNEIKSLPMVPLRGMTIMPGMVVHFDVSRARSIAAVQEAMVEEQKIFLTAQKSIDTEEPGAEDVYEIGTVGTVRQIIKLPSCPSRSCACSCRERQEDGLRRLNFQSRI